MSKAEKNVEIVSKFEIKWFYYTKLKMFLMKYSKILMWHIAYR